MLGSEELESRECWEVRSLTAENPGNGGVGQQRMLGSEELESRECWEVRSWRSENAGK
jgi:hypothetical protein